MKTLHSLRPAVAGLALALLISAAAGATALAITRETAGATAPEASPSKAEEWADHWGISVAGVRLSAQGRMIDFRYRVVDPVKAAALSNRAIKPILIDQRTGTKLSVPSTPKVGSLRQTAATMRQGRTCASLFWNPGQLVKSGSKVTVVFGDCRFENLIVE